MQTLVAGADAGEVGTAEGSWQGSPIKQEAILAAATAVFLREGYARASVDAIASEANVSKRTIYNHFVDKRELFLTVVERARRKAAIDLLLDETLLIDADRLGDDLVAFATGLIRAFLDPDFAALRRLVVAEVKHYPALSLACREGTPNRVMELLGNRLAGFNDVGALDIPDARRAADQFVGLLVYDLQRESAWGTAPLSDEQIAAIATAATDFFLRAYRRP